MSNFLKALNRLKNPVEKMEFFRKEDYRMQTIIANLNAMNVMINTRYSTYDKQTKTDINYLAEKYKLIFRDYRSAMIKDSKKVDLPTTLISINNRMIKEAESFYIESNIILDRIKKEMSNHVKRQYGQKLLEKIYPQKDEYMRSFDTVSEGVRAWECLVSIVEDGTIQLNDLPEYGIDIEGIVLD
jgi:hypothetical protein